MHRMARSNVFVSGMSGLGVEIGKKASQIVERKVTSFFLPAKNVILAGVKVLSRREEGCHNKRNVYL